MNTQQQCRLVGYLAAPVLGLTLTACGGSPTAPPAPTPVPMLGSVTNLTSAHAGSGRILLTWNGVASATGYRVFRDGAEVGTTAETTFTDTGLADTGHYCYTVRAFNSTLEGRTTGQVCDEPMPDWTGSWRGPTNEQGHEISFHAAGGDDLAGEITNLTVSAVAWRPGCLVEETVTFDSTIAIEDSKFHVATESWDISGLMLPGSDTEARGTMQFRVTSGPCAGLSMDDLAWTATKQ